MDAIKQKKFRRLWATKGISKAYISSEMRLCRRSLNKVAALLGLDPNRPNPQVAEFDDEEFKRLWLDKTVTRLFIIKHLGIGKDRLSKTAIRLGLDPHRGSPTLCSEEADPTPEEIEQRCLEIRSRWSEKRLLEPSYTCYGDIV